VLYEVLGELRVGRESDFQPLPGGRALVLLAVLLMNPNQLMSKETLIRAVWGRDVAEAQLHKHVGTVRALLAKVGRQGDLKTHSLRGYKLHVQVKDLDSLRFLDLVRQADEARKQSGAGAEIELLRQALGLWRGARPVSNVPADVFHQETELERRRKRAALRLVDLEFARGGFDRVLDDLSGLAADYPSDEPLCRRLMITCYRRGDAAGAVGAYERYEQALAQEWGNPGRHMRALAYAISQRDEAAIEVAIGTVFVEVTTPRQLPAAADLVGRADLLRETGWLLGREPDRSARIIVISGPAGSGKTALAVRVAQDATGHYSDGQLWAQLRSTAGAPADSAEVAAEFLRAFGVPRIPKMKSERLTAYRTLLADRRVLVVLDDAVDEEQVRDLVPGNPGCAVVVTARRRLPELGGAHHVAPLEPLDDPEAAELFLKVVSDAGIALPPGDRDAVDRVVHLSGGLPLAIRIAGAQRVRDHPRSTADLADRLARQGAEGFTYGSLSVDRAIGTAGGRLGENARRLLLGLGMLRLPDFLPWTAAALLAGTGADGDAELSELAAYFLVESVGGQPRYWLHDLTRDFAGRRARTELADATAELPARAYRALLTLTRHAHAALYGGPYEVVHSDVPDWPAPPALLAEIAAGPLGWFERERASIRAAVEHCAALGLADVAWDLAVSTHEFYTIRGYFDDWYVTHTQALGACQVVGDQLGEGILLACLGQPALVAGHRGHSISGPDELERAVDLLVAAGSGHGQAIALRTLGNALRRGGHLRRPLALFAEALGHYEASGDPVGRYQTLRFIGQTHLDLGAHGTALTELEKAARVARALDDLRLLAQSRYWVGQAQLAAGDLAAAAEAFGDVLAAFEGGVGRAYALHGMGDIATRRHDYGPARQHFDAAADLARGADAVLAGRVALSLASLHHGAGRPDLEREALADAVALFATCGAAYLQVRALAALGAAYAEGGDTVQADEAWHGVDELYVASGVPVQERILRRSG